MDAGIRIVLVLCALAAPAVAEPWLYFAEGNRLHRLPLAAPFDADRREVVIPSAADDPTSGRDINGMICPVPGRDGWIVTGEDTGQPERPAGWGVHDGRLRQIGKLVPPSDAEKPEPFGCAFDGRGRLFTTDVGDPGFGAGNGALLLWFPPWNRFPPEPDGDAASPAPSEDVCVLADGIGTAGAIAFDAEGRLYLASSSRFAVYRFSPPFPASRDECDRVRPRREVFLRGLATYSGLALAPGGNLYVASVATGRIDEVDLEGRLVRHVLTPVEWWPPFATGYPQGLAVDAEGTLYYADLDLVWHGWMPGPGPDGKIWRIRFGPDGEALEPEVLVRGLAFPDAVSVLSPSVGPRASGGP
jgi:hypothetical protein